MPENPRNPDAGEGATDPLWYKDAIIYEVNVKSFADSDGDGIGDFAGLIQKLDYLQDLGVTTIWLLPFYPSPLRDDGYDIADYTNVNPDYGSLNDFQTFLNEAHRRSLRVIIELVINHTSDQHEWFERSRRSEPDDAWRNFYVWSDTPERYEQARVIFKDFEPLNWSWDPVAKAYFWHRFYSHQPDLNFDSPLVREAIFEVLDFWLDLGVDGFRLDAVPYLFERDGTNCENLPETHAFLRDLRSLVDERFQNKLLLAEANQWPEEAVGYFGNGDECQMAFHFPLMPRLFMAARMEERHPIVEIINQTPEIPPTSQWALFLRNHDELTLEMVTDEDRDYMYRSYAQDTAARVNLGIRRRLAPLLGNQRRKMELMKSLLLSLPGTPVIYYGDEIGMGDNTALGDRDSVRTPMQWNSHSSAGFSEKDAKQLFSPVIDDPEFSHETINVESQTKDPNSLLWWTRRIISLRKHNPAFGRGTMSFLYPENSKILAFVRRYREQTIVVAANLSRFAQTATFDLSEFQGHAPVEMFGETPFPTITKDPYFLSFGPHGFYWFVLEPLPAVSLAIAAQPDSGVAAITTTEKWQDALLGESKNELEQRLPDYVQSQRWSGGKARSVRSVKIIDSMPLAGPEEDGAHATLLDIAYEEGENQVYVLAIGFAEAERADAIVRDSPSAAIARLNLPNGRSGLLFDAIWDADACSALLARIYEQTTSGGAAGSLHASSTRHFRQLWQSSEPRLSHRLVGAEQSNTSVILADKFILKLFRRPEEGTNLGLEMGRFLTEQTGFSHTPELAGSLEYRPVNGETRTVALLHSLVPNAEDAWRHTLEELGRYFERALALTSAGVTVPVENLDVSGIASHAKERGPAPIPPATLSVAADSPRRNEHQSLSEDALGAYLEAARLLGRRTADLHAALASQPDDPDFAPEPFTPAYQHSLRQAMHGQSSTVFQLLRRRLPSLSASVTALADQVLALEGAVNQRIDSLLTDPIQATRIRCHGDFHLGQVLYTGSDFVFIDFEGEPARSIAERRLKRTPLKDVAGMVRSFQYAAYAALRGLEDERNTARLEPWARFWQERCSAAFVAAYYEAAEPAGLLPPDFESRAGLVELYLLDKAFYEIAYEINNRPDWLEVALRGILQVMRHRQDA